MVFLGRTFLLLFLVVSLTFVVGFDKPKMIVIDPGHQEKADSSLEPDGPGSKVMKPKTTSGATGVSTKQPEYKLNLEVSLLLRDELKKRGFQVILTRETNNIKISNSERAEIANHANADLFIRIHADGANNANIQGISVLYPSKKVRHADEDKKLAAAVLEQTIKETKAASRGIVERSDLSGFNWSKVPTILIEMGFLSNVSEDKNMAAVSYQQSLAKGMAQGIEKHFASNSTNSVAEPKQSGDTYKPVETRAPAPSKATVTVPETANVEVTTPEAPVKQPELQAQKPKEILPEAALSSPPIVDNHAFIRIIVLVLVCLAIMAIWVKLLIHKKKN